MKHTNVRTVLAACSVAALLSLAACGGGGGGGGGGGDTGGSTGGSVIPGSALQTSEGLVAYLKDLIANMTNDTAEPVVLGDAVLPTSDTAEPVPLR